MTTRVQLLELLIRFGGMLHFGLLIAGALVPLVLKWGTELVTLSRLTRQIVWTHGVFIVLVIVGFGCLSLLLPEALASGTPLARSLCGFIALFWLGRLMLQIFYFDAESHLSHWVLRFGYRSLAGVFSYFAVVYGTAAIFIRAQ
jgi:hypothetical protein